MREFLDALGYIELVENSQYLINFACCSKHSSCVTVSGNQGEINYMNESPNSLVIDLVCFFYGFT